MSAKPPAPKENGTPGQTPHSTPSIYNIKHAHAREPWRRKPKAREPGARRRRSSTHHTGSWIKPLFITMVIVYAAGVTGFIILQWRDRWAADNALREKQPAVFTPVAPSPGNTNLTEFLENIREADQLAERLAQALDTEQIQIAVEEISRAGDPLETVNYVHQYARLLTADGRPQMADLYYQRGVRMDPSREVLFLEWIGVKERLGQQEEALRIAEWFIEDRPEAYHVHRLAARLCAALSRPARAAEHLGRYLAEFSMDDEAREELAEIYIATERWQDAEQLLERSIELAMSTEENYRMLLRVYAEQRKNAEILQTVRRASILFGRKRVDEWMVDPELDYAHRLLGEQWVKREQLRVEQARERRRKQPQLLDLQMEEELLFKD